MSRKTLRRALQVFAFVAVAPLLTACDLDFTGVGGPLAESMAAMAAEEAAVTHTDIAPMR